MSEQELIEIIRLAGRYEVLSDGNGNYVSVPIQAAAMLIAPDSHRECLEFFQSQDD